MAGKNPLVAYQHIVLGAFGSWDRDRRRPEQGRALHAGRRRRRALLSRQRREHGRRRADRDRRACGLLRGADRRGERSAPLVLPAAMLAGILGGAAWAAIAAAINLWRGVHEVLVTLMMNFIAWLIVAEFLHGPLGEIDAGFPQTPMFEQRRLAAQAGRAHRSAHRHRARGSCRDRGACRALAHGDRLSLAARRRERSRLALRGRIARALGAWA